MSEDDGRLQIKGAIVRQGTFSGHLPNGGKDERPPEITSLLIRKMYDRLSGRVPIYNVHTNVEHTSPVGYLDKISLSPKWDMIQSSGYIMEKEGIAAYNNGAKSFSPEIEYFKDASGNIIDAELSCVVLVSNPAIEGTDVDTVSMYYSKTFGDVSMPRETQPTEPTQGGNTPTVTPFDPNNIEGFLKSKGVSDDEIAQIKSSIKPTVTKEPSIVPPAATTPTGNPNEDILAKIDALTKLVSDQQNAINGFTDINNKLLTEKYNTILEECKSAGIDRPGDIVKALPLESKINVLQSMLTSVVKTKPLVDHQGGAPAKRTAEETKRLEDEAFAELGFTRKAYDEIMGEKS